jgi:hypothetical protein
MTPLVISLLTVWPVAIAVYRSDLFRSGGADAGAGRWVFQGLWLASVIWGFALLLIGMRVVHGWTWSRSLAAVAVAALVLVGVALAVSVA